MANKKRVVVEVARRGRPGDVTQSALNALVPPIVDLRLAESDAPAQAAAAAVTNEIATRELAEMKGGARTEDIAGGVAFRDGKATWLTTTRDGGPTAYAVEKIEDAGFIPGPGDVAIRRVDKASDIAGGIVFGGGRASWLTTTSNGGPTGYAIQKMAEAGFGQAENAVEQSDQRLTPIALGSEWQAYATHPRLVKPRDTAALMFANQVAASMYWPMLVDLRPIGRHETMLIYSTDHSGGPGGLYGAVATGPLETFTDAGLLYRDTVTGAETETPSVIWDEASGEYLVFYHQNGGFVDLGQATLLATTPDFVTFTRVGVVLNDDASGTGNHTGYMRPFRINGDWYAYSLWVASTPPTMALWSSPDGRSWTKQASINPYTDPTLAAIPGYSSNWYIGWYHGDVINWRGELWWIGLIGPEWSGVTTPPMDVYAARLNPNLRSFAHTPIKVTPPGQAWEGGGISQFGGAFTWQGRLFMPYRGATKTNGLGIMEVL